MSIYQWCLNHSTPNTRDRALLLLIAQGCPEQRTPWPGVPRDGDHDPLYDALARLQTASWIRLHIRRDIVDDYIGRRLDLSRPTDLIEVSFPIYGQVNR